MKKSHGGDGRLGLLRHALAFAPEIRRDILINGGHVMTFARKYELERDQVQFAVNLLRWARSNKATLSPERLALIVMQDVDFTDEDVGEVFGRSTRWATLVREQADEIRAEQPIPADLDRSDAFLWPRSIGHDQRESETKGRMLAAKAAAKPPASRPPQIREYYWSRNAFIQFGT